MRAPPPISHFPRYPVTAGTAALAIITTLLVWSRGSISSMDMNYLAFHGEPWRLLTSALPHIGIFHLAFNVYWLWIFGTLIEETFGSLRTASLFIILAAGSAAAEWAGFSGGVGLSGIGYGLFGFLWILSRWDRRLRGVVDRQTVIVFVAWFFLCIVLTATGAMAVANVAHGAGAVLGMLAALVSLASTRQRPLAAALLVLVLLGIGWAATAGRPFVNFSREASDDLGSMGYDALNREDYPSAIKYFTMATSYRKVNPVIWCDFGIALQRVGQNEKAFKAFSRASELDPTSASYRQAAQSMRAAQNPR